MTGPDRTMRIVPGSSSSAFCPPGHPMLFHHIEAGPGRNTKRGPNLIAGLDYALENEYGDVPERIREAVAKLYAEATLVRSELWERQCYSHWRNCYSPDGLERRADRLLIVGMGEPYYPGHPKVESGEVKLSEYHSLNRGPAVTADDPRCTPEHHAGYLYVKKFFPDAQPRLDLIAHPPVMGSHPCSKCGTHVQYESRFDGWAEFQSSQGLHTGYGRTCPQGGVHEVAEAALTQEGKA